MINLQKINNLYFIQTTNKDDKKTASASYEVFSKGLFEEFINTLIKKEIEDIRVFDGADDLSDHDILMEFEENFEEFISLKKSVLESDSIVYLHNIENKGIEKGAAKEIVDYLKSNYDKIILYSLEEARGYWISANFKAVLRDEYYGFNF